MKRKAVIFSAALILSSAGALLSLSSTTLRGGTRAVLPQGPPAIQYIRLDDCRRSISSHHNPAQRTWFASMGSGS